MIMNYHKSIYKLLLIYVIIGIIINYTYYYIYFMYIVIVDFHLAFSNELTPGNMRSL